MADLRFRKGLHSTMPSAISEGTIYVTTDEKAMYVDISNTQRIRLGQIISYNTYEDFRKLTQPPYSTEAFYYIADENALLKWCLKKDSTTEYEWRQINNISDVTANIGELQGAVSTLQGDTANLQKQINVVTYGQETKPEGATDAGANLNLNKLKTDLGTAQSTAAQGVSDAAAALAKANEGVANAATAQAAAEAAQGTANTAAGQAAENKTAIGKLQADISGENGIDSKVAGLTTRMGTAETNIGKNATAAQEAKTQADKGVQDAAAAQSTANTAKSLAENNQTAIAGLTTTVNDNKAAAEADATSKANTAEANAKAYADSQIASKLQAADAMVFKGTIDATHALPTSEIRVGDTYKVAAAGTYNSQQAYIGDLFIAQGTEDTTTGYISSELSWAYVPSGYVADYNPHLTAGAPATASNKTALENAIHLTSGSAAANTYGDLGIVKFASSNSGLTVNVANTNSSSATVTLGLVWEDWN